MRRMLCLLVVGLVFLPARLPAAEYPEWKGYPPMYSIKDVIEFRGRVYCATAGGMFIYDPETREYTLYYKNHGLVSNDVTCLGATAEAVFVGFREDGLWRFDPDSETFTRILFPEYHVKTSTYPNGIAIHDIYAKNDSILYIGHEYGVDVLNLYTEEIRTYTDLGPEITENKAVNDVNVFGGRLWVSTPLGLAVADEDDPNLEFEENWTNYVYTVFTGFNVTYGITGVLHVTVPGDTIYVGTNRGGIFVLDEERGKILPAPMPSDLTSTRISAMTEALGEYWAASSEGLLKKSVNFWSIRDDTYTELTALYAGTEDRLWVGTMFDGLQCYTGDGYADIPPLNEMKNMTFYDIDIDRNGVLWCVTTYRDRNMESTFQRLEGDVWSAYELDDWAMTNRVVSVLVDDRGLVWTAIWGSDRSGAFVIKDDGTPFKTEDEIIPVDESMEILRPTIERRYVVCSDLAKDRHGNVWVANYQVDPPDHRIEPEPSSGAVVFDGFPYTKYQSYSPAEDGLPTAIIFNMCTDDDGWVWLGTYNKGVTGIYVGEDPFDKSDTEVHRLSKAEDGLHYDKIAALACDMDGFVWVGTEGGLNRIVKEAGHELRVEDMNRIFDERFKEVHVIEVDRYNNKWIGSSEGLVKINADNEQERFYTTGNSGLFSNFILSLKYDDERDVLWVGTGAGLNRLDVFGGEAAGGGSDVRVYPNPFEIWGYDSKAVFPNLKRGSSVKIYSFTGELVNELPSSEDPGNGGASAVWNGRNFQGGYVGSGVYFFTGIDAGGRSYRDKMVVIRR